jgi:type I restriction enzyme M protein
MDKDKSGNMSKKKATTAKKDVTQKTTAQQLGSLIKSARDIMRKDRGLNGDLDRLPLLTWVMFLKFLDDREKLEEARSEIGGKKYKSAVDAPYRWRDWAANKDGITGDELIAFVNQDEATRPGGSKGPGLLAYLRSLQATAEDRRRGVIATVFNGVNNRMLSGYLLRDVINLVDGIHFDSTEEIHTLARLYESMLREMRDAAGDSGEFYTPRPVVQFMVKVINPQLGEVVLDPACGTGGFLSETFEHLEKQCSTVQHRKILQEKSIYGGEAKPLPYMLAQMNLLLQGLDAPAIEYGNSLTVKITELGAKDRVDVILTNPPFGGEEEAGIRNNFPADKQTSETALLFLQLIMRKLRKPIGNNTVGGRAAVVVPNGTLFGDGVCARIKEELLKEFNLHTIVRLPNGVFAPYTGIATNLLFFDRGGPTKKIWFYELPLPEGRKNYSKTKPIQIEEFDECVKWFSHEKRKATANAWKVPVKDVLQYDTSGNLLSCNLDSRNPNSPSALEHMETDRLLSNILNHEDAIAKLLKSADVLVAPYKTSAGEWDAVPLGDVVKHRKEFEMIDDAKKYKRCRVQLHAQGIVLRDVVFGEDIKTKKQQICRPKEFLVAEIDAKVGGFGIVPIELDGAIVSSHYFLFTVDESLLLPDFLGLVLQTLKFREQVEAQGSTNYAAIRPSDVLSYRICLPPIDHQEKIVAIAKAIDEAKQLQKSMLLELNAVIPSILSTERRKPAG